MELSEEDLGRLADIVELQPTKNATLQERWGMDSGSDVHQYLESTLGEYYYRDDNSLIRATADAADLVDVEPGVEATQDDEGLIVRVPALERQIVDVLPAPGERSMSVVSVLQSLRATYDVDPAVEQVREGLNNLRRKGVVTVTYRLVPTYSLAVPRDQLQVEPTSAEA